MLYLHKTELSVDDLDTHVTGKVYNFLTKAAPKHTGQSKTFSDSLFATVSARGRKTNRPVDFSSLVAHCGYSKADFLGAVEALRSVPDQQEIISSWLSSLLHEEMPIREFTKLQIRLTQMLERRLGNGKSERGPLHTAVETWVAANPVGDSVLAFLNAGTTAIIGQMPGLGRDEVQAAILLEGISQCQSQT